MPDAPPTGAVVSLICDGGGRYGDTCHDDAWRAAEGLDVAGQRQRLEQVVAEGRWLD
jgi:cysteine synthase A